MQLTKNNQETIKNGVFCETCGEFIHNYTIEWGEYAGLSSNRWNPKYVPRCNRCNELHFNNTVREVNEEFYRKNLQRKEDMSEENVPVSLNWQEIENLINSRQLKVVAYAQSINMAPNDFRQHLVDHYGGRVVFRRGRGGGVMFNSTDNSSVAQSPEKEGSD